MMGDLVKMCLSAVDYKRLNHTEFLEYMLWLHIDQLCYVPDTRDW
tara:strand:+ start:272 stop:406 length:135 start_codon:yes stop_codon:yes gene_type:complete